MKINLQLTLEPLDTMAEIPAPLQRMFAWVVGNTNSSWFCLQLLNLWDETKDDWKDIVDQEQFAFEICQACAGYAEELTYDITSFCTFRAERELLVSGYEDMEDACAWGGNIYEGK